ncbi:nitrilase [Vibrio ishigakensis]|uniref:Nitrilase n=1 Tax=Vibrio ishigakensis TaxID=1481914 RepID=A0A0B8PB64_9VIBR|nr:nitrilase [Vibrio ishigakensis]
MALGNEIHSRLRLNAVDIHNGGLDKICGAAKANSMVIVIGINEIDTEFSGSTLYNSVVVIDADGSIVNCHRKLMPTNPERMVWGFGDARGLQVVDTAVGRIGALICWENYMPLVDIRCLHRI